MKNMLLLLCFSGLLYPLHAQDKKITPKKEPARNDLTSLRKCITDRQADATLYTDNAKDHSREHDVNSIILDIEKYIDSLHGMRSMSDQMLVKYFNPLRHFFLTTTNKTSVATFFLFNNTPYQFCTWNDTATALYLGAIKDGSQYNLGKMTERKIVRSCFENCLLPSLKALDEFTGADLKYVAISAYYGCKDTREGAPPNALSVYCLTFVARTTDLQQYAAGLITTKGLLANGEIYLGDEESPGELRRIQLAIE